MDVISRIERGERELNVYDVKKLDYDLADEADLLRLARLGRAAEKAIDDNRIFERDACFPGSDARKGNSPETCRACIWRDFCRERSNNGQA